MDSKSIIRRIKSEKRANVKAKCYLTWISPWNRDPFKQITRRIRKNRKHKTEIVIWAINKLCFSSLSQSQLSLLSHCWVSPYFGWSCSRRQQVTAKQRPKNRKLHSPSFTTVFDLCRQSHFRTQLNIHHRWTINLTGIDFKDADFYEHSPCERKST